MGPNVVPGCETFWADGDVGGDAEYDVGGDTLELMSEVMEVILEVMLMLLLKAPVMMLVLICR